jgi:hypothetical protein
VSVETGNADLVVERKHFDMLKSVEDFDASQLKKTDTVEKALLPSNEGSKSVGVLCEDGDASNHI